MPAALRRLRDAGFVKDDFSRLTIEERLRKAAELLDVIKVVTRKRRRTTIRSR